MGHKRLMKAVSLFLIGSVVFGCAACSKKPSAKNLDKVATSKLDAEEIALEDIKDMEQDEIMEALEDGIVIKTNGEEIDDVFGKQIKKADTSSAAEVGDAVGVDIDDWDTDDLGDITVYAKAEGVDKLGEGDVDDANIVFATVVEFTDKDKANEAFEDFMGNIEDLMEDELDLDLEDLSEDEYLNDGDKGHFVICMGADDIIDGVKDMYKQYGADMDKDQLKEMQKMFGDLQIVVGVYYDNGVFTIVGGFSANGLDDLETVCDKLGIDNPLEVENSDELKEALISGVIGGGISKYIDKAQSAMAQVEEHNEAIREVEEEIDNYV